MINSIKSLRYVNKDPNLVLVAIHGFKDFIQRVT